MIAPRTAQPEEKGKEEGGDRAGTRRAQSPNHGGAGRPRYGGGREPTPQLLPLDVPVPQGRFGFPKKAPEILGKEAELVYHPWL